MVHFLGTEKQRLLSFIILSYCTSIKVSAPAGFLVEHVLLNNVLFIPICSCSLFVLQNFQEGCQPIIGSKGKRTSSWSLCDSLICVRFPRPLCKARTCRSESSAGSISSASTLCTLLCYVISYCISRDWLHMMSFQLFVIPVYNSYLGE